MRDTDAAAGGKGQHADIIDGRQAGQLWDVLLSFGFVVRGSGSGVAVMQGRGRERGEVQKYLNRGFELIQGAVRARMPNTSTSSTTTIATHS